MKKKVWTVTPIFLILTFLMIIMAGISLFCNMLIFYIELTISIFAVSIVLFRMSKFRSYIKNTVKNAEESLNNVNEINIEKFPLPVVVIGDKSDIVLYNSHFLKDVCKEDDPTGKPISSFLNGKTVDQILEKNSVDIEYKDSKFTVFGVSSSGTTILYFIENTYYKNISNEYKKSRPSVAIIVFDNKEEIERGSTDGKDAYVSSMIENTIQKWVSKTTGFFKKLNDGRYLMIVEDRYMDTLIKEKFKILEEVRNIKLDARKWPTISIGVGKGGSSLKECENWARIALDMALGRGGDQAAVKQGETYQFFGGTSKGYERRNKVRTRVIAATLSDHIKASDRVLIMGHKFSDLDCVGSSVGMYSVIVKGLKNKANIVVNKNQSLASALIDNIKIVESDDIFIPASKAMNLVTDKTLLIILDTHSSHFVESMELYKKCKKVVVIDHHRMMVNHIDNALIFYHEPYASSASEMVTELIQYMGYDVLNRIEAEALLSGIMLDTKDFVLKTGVRTFEAAAYLRSQGADTVEVKRLFSNTIDTYKAKYHLVSGAEIFNSCAIACTDEDYNDIRLACVQAADELLEIQGVVASFVMYTTPNDPKTINVSARSMGEVNVQLIMEAMGGGGHQTMAGAQIENSTMEHVREKLVGIISELKIEKL